MRIQLTFLLLLVEFAAWSQTKITGRCVDENNQGIAGANVFIKKSIEGASCDSLGYFSFTCKQTGNQTIVASFIGFDQWEQAISCNNTPITVHVTLHEKSNTIDAVTVTAGSFEASDEKKAVALKPIDIITVANSVGDIMGALATLPGAQRGLSDGFLVVRGGDATETKTFIDGQCVDKPYTSQLPDVPSRGRFSPMLFKGTLFSTGGFSAQYGQALSSIIQLETMNLAEQSQMGISLMSVGAGISGVLRRNNISISSELTYANMKPYYLLTGSNIAWINQPNSIHNTSTARFKIGKSGMLKTMVQISSSKSAMLYNNLDTKKNDSLRLHNANLYVNTSYQSSLSNQTNWGAATALVYDADSLQLQNIHLHTQTIAISENAWIKHSIGNNSVRWGIQCFNRIYNQQYYNSDSNFAAQMFFKQMNVASYVEFEHRFTKQFVMKHGYRYEYTNQNNEHTLAPRLSWAYKVTQTSQISLAWGIFRQLQADDFMKFNAQLQSAKSLQYILNYQYEKNNRMFRSEVYYKKYKQLITYKQLNNPDPQNYSTLGNGMATGIDLFYRDRKTIPNGDFWLTYSFIATQRKYKDYSSSVQPDYVSPYTASIVYKQFFSKIQTQIGAAYSFASAKRYNNPNENEFMNATLQPIHDLSLSFSYITKVFGQMMIIHGSVSNLFCVKNIYGYRFAANPDANGTFQSASIVPIATHTLFLGIFINL